MWLDPLRLLIVQSPVLWAVGCVVYGFAMGRWSKRP